MKRVYLSIITFLFLLTTIGCKRYEWKEFRSPECGFSALMPEGVSQYDQVTYGDQHESETYLFYSQGQHQTYYTVQYGELSEKMQVLSPEADLNSFVKGRVESFNGDILLYRRESLNGYPGREIKIQNEDGNYHFCRFYLVGRRLYVLSVFAPHENAASRDIERFFDSFKLL